MSYMHNVHNLQVSQATTTIFLYFEDTNLTGLFCLQNDMFKSAGIHDGFDTVQLETTAAAKKTILVLAADEDDNTL